MDVRECEERSEELARFLELGEPVSIEELQDGLYSIAEKVVFPCLAAGRFGASSSAGGNPIIDIPIVLDGNEIGFFCLTSKFHELGIDPSSATDAQKHALIRFSSPSDFDAGTLASMRISKDSVVIDKNQLHHFLRNRATSAVWGGFVLESDAISLEQYVADASGSRIDVIALAEPRTRRHRAALQRATESPIAVDRFLHLYHFLELDYDHEIVKRIREIDPDNTKGLEKLLVTGRSELDRLHLVSEGFSQIGELERVAGILKAHRETALVVFYDYGKEHNPLKDRAAFEQQFLDAPAINRATLDDIKKRGGLDLNFAKDESSYEAMLVKLACYWIYRIRCCIAHNKLGEYHLSTPPDMRFVGEFGEALITALIVHRLKPQGPEGEIAGP